MQSLNNILNILTGDNLLIETIQDSQFKCNYLRNKKHLLNLFPYFSNLYWILNILEKKKSLISDVFPKLRTPKNVVKKISKNSPLRGPFDKQHAKLDQTLLKSERHHVYHIYWSLWRQLRWKKYLLVICKLLGMFIKTLTADHKYSLLRRDNLRQPIRIQLLQKEKNRGWTNVKKVPFLKTLRKTT